MPHSRFADKVVFLTGAAGGLGLAACKLFIEEGAIIFATDLRGGDILEELGSDRATYFKCDVGSIDDCRNAVEECIRQHGRLDVLFHNAGRFPHLSYVHDMEATLYHEIINVDFNSLFYLVKAAAPHMKTRGGGSIIVTSSTSGLGGDSGNAAYGAAKAGVINMARCLAIDYAGDGIRVNCICPGYMLTGLTNAFRDAPEAEKRLLDAIPMHRGADPYEVARVVLFLASEEASFITGQALPVDGGQSIGSGTPNMFQWLDSKLVGTDQHTNR